MKPSDYEKAQEPKLTPFDLKDLTLLVRSYQINVWGDLRLISDSLVDVIVDDTKKAQKIFEKTFGKPQKELDKTI